MDNRRIFAFLQDCLTLGHASVLVTVIAVDGSSMRGPGTHMGVCQDGRFAGSLSGGCIENAVVAEALDVLKTGAARVVRFGSGSPYIDIKLPCGGGLDIHFQPLRDAALIVQCCQAIGARQPFSLELSQQSRSIIFAGHWQETVWHKDSGRAVIGHWPEPKLLIIGHGATIVSLSRLAREMDLTVEVLTPEHSLLDELEKAGTRAVLLATPSETYAIRTDPWTAVVFLFHDHDWEIALMEHALRQPHFYLGAMGGRKAHTFRSEALRQLGCSEADIETIRAPIGLFHSSRDPDTLALSTLGQVIECYHRHGFSDAGG